MEEVVSTAIEQKHRFMVDVVLYMGILEDEHVRLETRINNFTGERWRGGGGIQGQDSNEDVEDEDDEEEVKTIIKNCNVCCTYCYSVGLALFND